MTIRLRALAIVVLVVLTLATAAGALMLHLGVYNIAATAQHTRLVFRLMDYAMLRSVKARSDPLAVPDLTDRSRVRNGAVHYRAHCLQCHGAPGVSPDPLAFGLTPAPANLVSTARLWKPQEIFWVVKHGIKMTGMPAWEFRLADEEIWDVVAFIEAMATLSAGEYVALAATLPTHTHKQESRAPAMAGDAQAGRRATERYLCATCHTIPGVVGANRHVGPPLNGIGRRQYIAGIVTNTPENMVRFLKDPQQLDPLSAMPALGLSTKDARDIAAFMSTLDDVR